MVDTSEWTEVPVLRADMLLSVTLLLARTQTLSASVISQAQSHVYHLRRLLQENLRFSVPFCLSPFELLEQTVTAWVAYAQ